MFPYRGVRTLPRLVDETGVRTDVDGKDEDAAMLYAYLHELGGHLRCAHHGHRQRDRLARQRPRGRADRRDLPGLPQLVRARRGPRVLARQGDRRRSRKGMIWNALALQYRLGFEASSDHVSTHISFAVALAEDHSRQAIFEAFKQRHCYAATDNILLDVRSGDHLMGDEFATEGPVTLKVSVHGTAPIQRIDVIKDSVYAYSTEPQHGRRLVHLDRRGASRSPA